MKLSFNFNVLAAVLFTVAVGLYINSMNNEYALDDEIILQKNEFVLKGFAGLPEIFTSDMFASYYKAFNADQQLSGGRYRPLSQATFAIDYAIFGDNPMARHLINVLLFGLLTVVIFYLLARSLQMDLLVSFLVAFLFAIHPIHTEAVANIKSRDEILSLLFYVSAIIFFLKGIDTAKWQFTVLAALSYALALFSKEYGITLLVILPLTAVLFRKQAYVPAVIKSWWLWPVFLIYAFIRVQVTGLDSVPQMDPINNPYTFATAEQKLATEIFVLLKYLLLLVWPYPLSADYGYNQIPYKDFASLEVIASLLIHVSLIAWTAYAILKKQKVAFALSLYLLNLLLVSNFIFNIGATMGERLIFHSSLGFCMLVGYGFEKLKKRVSSIQFSRAVGAFAAVTLLLSAMVIIPRNADWKTTHTLFAKDVKTMPNSALANSNAAVAYINWALLPENAARKTEYLKLGGKYARRATEIHPKYTNAFINLGVSYFNMEQYDSAFAQWEHAYQLFPSYLMLQKNAELAYNKGCDYGREKNFEKASYFLAWCIKLQPGVAAYWGDYGGALCSLGKFAEARTAWQKALELDPNNQQALQGLPFVHAQLAGAMAQHK